MRRDHTDLETRIEALLRDPAYQEHPMREALESLWQYTMHQLTRLERVSHVSDEFQAMARQRELGLMERYDRQVNQMSRAARISDRYQRMLQDLNRTLREASYKDPLTGLFNRRLLMDRLKEESLRAERSGHGYVLGLLDLDYFKRINDGYGHDAGDRVLVEIAGVMRAAIREYDLCGRWGGEEFLLLLPETGHAEGHEVLGRVLAAIRNHEMHYGDQPLVVSASGGLAVYRSGESYAETLKRADRALYVAKRQGRDRIVGEDQLS